LIRIRSWPHSKSTRSFYQTLLRLRVSVSPHTFLHRNSLEYVIVVCTKWPRLSAAPIRDVQRRIRRFSSIRVRIDQVNVSNSLQNGARNVRVPIQVRLHIINNVQKSDACQALVRSATSEATTTSQWVLCSATSKKDSHYCETRKSVPHIQMCERMT